MTLNIGCGSNKITGCINIDVEPTCSPDVIADVQKGLPYENESVDKIYFFHCIEHISAARHPQVLNEFRRVLKPDGRLIMSFPEFRICAEYWIKNHRGMRDFWKATLFGRQLYPTDYHVALMDSMELKDILMQVGFKDIEFFSEQNEEFNTVCKCRRGDPMPLYEEVLTREIFGLQ